MAREPHLHELATLKTIAEKLNQISELQPLLGEVLELLLALTGLTTGWIYVETGPRRFSLAADVRLPQALSLGCKRPMQGNYCWCLTRFATDELTSAVNILSCKRIEMAVRDATGDTGGITHHATVPLRAGPRRFGVLNVAAPGKTQFEPEELALLESVALQIGSAVERVQLYEAERRRAAHFAQLGELGRALAAASGERAGAPLAVRIVEELGTRFGWPYVAMIDADGAGMRLRAVYDAGGARDSAAALSASAAEQLGGRMASRRYGLGSGSAPELRGARIVLPEAPDLLAAFIVPFAYADDSHGLILVGAPPDRELDKVDIEVLEALSEQIAAAFVSERDEESRRELARLDERNRLARDLHDSVTQMLFSLSMTAKGVEAQLAAGEMDAAAVNVGDMRRLSQTALKEMRALILQLRPSDLEDGVLRALAAYAGRIGLRATARQSGAGRRLSGEAEQALRGIGQEALNNIAKHAGVREAEIELAQQGGQVVLRIADGGRGIGARPGGDSSADHALGQGGPGEGMVGRLADVPAADAVASGGRSIGLSTMRERCEALGGTLHIYGEEGRGTTVEAILPIKEFTN